MFEHVARPRLISLLISLKLFAPFSTCVAKSGLAVDNGATSAERNPVLLIHGIRDSAKSMRTLERWLTRHGREVHTLSLLPSDGSTPLPDLARQVAAYVDKTVPPARKIDLVGFSMGGVVCRFYLQRLDGARRVQRFVNISAPNYGTWLAYASNKPGCIQMRPRSSFLNDLNADTRELQNVQLTTVWTPFDLTILPARSSRMRLGNEVRTWVIAHPLMVHSHGVLRAVSDALAIAEKATAK